MQHDVEHGVLGVRQVVQAVGISVEILLVAVDISLILQSSILSQHRGHSGPQTCQPSLGCIVQVQNFCKKWWRRMTDASGRTWSIGTTAS